MRLHFSNTIFYVRKPKLLTSHEVLLSYHTSSTIELMMRRRTRIITKPLQRGFLQLSSVGDVAGGFETKILVSDP